jgi:hypothetical protein
MLSVPSKMSRAASLLGMDKISFSNIGESFLKLLIALLPSRADEEKHSSYDKNTTSLQ